MIREIYTRSADDPNYYEGLLDTNNELEILLAKIRMILGTDKGEVLGEYELGTDIESLVFKTTKDAKYIEDEINKQLKDYVLSTTNKYRISPKVKFGHHNDGYDYAIIDINVNDIKIQSFMID